jgi:ATP-binding cassette subfamily B protein
MLPALTANIIDIISTPGADPSGLWFNALLLVLLLAQNVPLHTLYARYLSRAVRETETRLRAAICRRLQHLSISYYTRQSAASLQTKVLRDVENIEQMTRTLYDGGLSAASNIIFALAITAWRVPEFLIFYLLVVPVAALLVRALRQTLAERNRAFRQELETLSTRVEEMTHLIPITRAHGLEEDALERVNETLYRVRESGERLDSVNAVFGALSWMTFNLFNVLCVVAAAWAYWTQIIPLTIGEVVMLTSYFSTLTNAVMVLANMTPQISKGLESIRSIGEVLENPDLEQNQGKVAVARKLLITVWHTLTYGEVDRFATDEQVACSFFALAYKLQVRNLPDGMSALQFTRHHLDRLGIGPELTHIHWGSKTFRLPPSKLPSSGLAEVVSC